MQRKMIAAIIPLAALCLFAQVTEVKAEESSTVTCTDNSTYSVVIPAEVVITDPNDTENLSLSVTTKQNCDVEIQVQSKYTLKNGNYSVSYKIPDRDKALVFSNEKKEDKIQEYSINVSVTGQAPVSGIYTDQLTFVMRGKSYPENKYKLNFDLNCTDENYDIYTEYKLLIKNEEYGILPTPAQRDGYEFDGWYTAKTGGTEVNSNTVMGSEDTTVYAHWTPYTLTINYHNDGAEYIKWESGNESVADVDVTAVQIETYGTTFTNGVNGLYDVWRWNRSGYTAKGSVWKIGKDGIAEYNDHVKFDKAENCAEYLGVLEEFKKGNVTVDLYPIWNANNYTVRYDKNDADASGSTASSRHTYDVERSLTPNGFSRKGYAFAHWTTGTTDTEPFYADMAVVKNLTTTNNGTITLYAQWTPNTSTVQYDPNDGNPATVFTTLTYDVPTELISDAYDRNGFVLTGWNTEADGSGTAYESNASVKNLTAEDNGTVTLYAQWKASTYTIQYDSNSDEDDVTGSMEPSICTYGIEQLLASNEFVRDGYLFVGWNEEEDGSGIAYDDEEAVENLTDQENGEITLYAQWEEDEFIFDPNAPILDEDELLASPSDATPSDAEQATPSNAEILDEEEDFDDATESDYSETSTSETDEDSKQKPQNEINAVDADDNLDFGTNASEEDGSSEKEKSTEADKDDVEASEQEPCSEPEESAEETEPEEDTAEEEESIPEKETADVAKSKEDFEEE